MSADYAWVYSSLHPLAMAHPLCTGKPQMNVVWKQHLAPSATAEQTSHRSAHSPSWNYHCTSKAQSLKGKSCSKLMFKILHGLYISHTLPVC